MYFVRSALVWLSLIVSLAANAGAYKCIVNGKTQYQQSPCAGDGTELKLSRESEAQKLNRQIDSMEATQRRLELENMAREVDANNARIVNAQMEMLKNQRLAQEQIDYHQKRAEELRVLEEESKDRDRYMEVWSRNHAEEHEKAANSLR